MNKVDIVPTDVGICAKIPRDFPWDIAITVGVIVAPPGGVCRRLYLNFLSVSLSFSRPSPYQVLGVAAPTSGFTEITLMLTRVNFPYMPVMAGHSSEITSIIVPIEILRSLVGVLMIIMRR